MSISACLIVKDEQNTLGRCLESIRDHVDEIVIVDTGSRDQTKAIASGFSARILDYPWRHDFAAARQFSFDHAAGDWVFWVDADDIVHNAARIRSTVEKAPPDVNCFYWKYQAGSDQYGNSTCEFWRERCVRNNHSFRWSGRVHEVLVPRARAVIRQDDDVLVVHRRQTAGRNPRRNLEILQLEYARSGSRTPPRLLYNLACEYADLGQREPALQYFRRYVNVSQWQDEKYFALLRMAELERVGGRFSEAELLGRKAFELIPPWPNACFSLAETYYFLRNWPQVVNWSELGRDRSFPTTICVMNPLALRYGWMIHYTNALYHVGRVRDAFDWTCKALEICPREEWHTFNQRFFSEKIETPTVRAPSPDTAELGTVSGSPAISPSELPQILWHGPLLDPSGYAEEGREFVMGMDAIGLRVRALPLEWSSTRVELTPKESAMMDRLIQTGADEMPIRVFHVQPVHWQRDTGARRHIGRTMCETDRIPPSWVDPCNAMDEVWVPCQHNVETFANSGVDRRKLIKMPQGINLERYQYGGDPLPVRGARPFNFLSVFEWSRHKGWDVLVRAFVAEFRSHEGVALILKTGAAGGQSASAIRQAIIAELRTAGLGASLPPHIVILAGKLPTAQMPALYRAANAFVLSSRGEGWCRPLMEAMLMGLPSIGTRSGGPLEFMNDENSYLVDCAVVDVPTSGWRDVPVFRGHRWAEPSVRHLRQLMRRIVCQQDEARQKARAGREHIINNFSRERVARLVEARLRQTL
jgi:glycosyltransferase involved in cell wall biosynthesis